MEGTTCIAGEYHEIKNDCESYLQCVSGQWSKQSCAPGLHWNMKSNRCDWPSSAKCNGKLCLQYY